MSFLRKWLLYLEYDIKIIFDIYYENKYTYILKMTKLSVAQYMVMSIFLYLNGVKREYLS